jgi:hypothetical protein
MSEKKLNEKSAELILQTSKDLYIEEMDRFKNTEVKSGILLTAAGVIFTVYLSILKDIKVDWISKHLGFYCFFLLVSIIVLSCIVISVTHLLLSLKGDKYEQVSINSIVDEEFAKDDPCDVAFDIAATYQNVINRNREKLENKTRYFNEGLYFLSITVIFIVLYALVEGAMKLVI